MSERACSPPRRPLTGPAGYRRSPGRDGALHPRIRCPRSAPAIGRQVAAAAALGVGFVGGAVVGRLSDDLAAARRNGAVVGVAGGLPTAVLVRGTMSLALPRARWGAIWALEYAIATGLGSVVSSDSAATYDLAIGIGIVAAVGGLVFVESLVGAVAASPFGVEPFEEE